MAIKHIVKAGDCISGIAFEYGFFPDTVWNDPGNAQLKNKRKNHNTLVPGDIVLIPDKAIKRVDKAAGQRHQFRRMGVPEYMRFRFQIAGDPRANEPYQLEVDGAILSSGDKRTDSKGYAKHPIPPDARIARFTFDKGAEEYVFHLGGLEPIETVRGLQGRLTSLGLYGGPIDGNPSDQLTQAVAAFQADRGLIVTGEADDETRNRLAADHGV